jgi:cell division protein FtsB
MAIGTRWRRWGLRIGLVALGVYYAVWGGEYSAFDLGRLEAERVREHAEVERLAAEVDSLRVRAEALEKDPETLERLARERFGMIRQGEVLYRFVEVEEAPVDTDRTLATGP